MQIKRSAMGSRIFRNFIAFAVLAMSGISNAGAFAASDLTLAYPGCGAPQGKALF